MTTTPQLLPYLERLLDGETVEWKTLGEVAEYVRQRVAVDQLCAQTYVGVDNLLPNRAGKQDSNYLPSEGNAIAYQPNDILIGNIRPYLKKIWKADNEGGASADVLVVRITNSLLTPGYLYHLLADDRFFSYDMQHAKGAKMPRGNKEKILDYVLPIPPLRVQTRIVEILDKFTQLEAELEAELEARNKQYDFYRNRLLSGPLPHSPNIPHQWEQVPLGSIGEVRMCKRILKQDTTETGEIPFYKIGTFGKSADAFISRTLFEEYKQKYTYPRIGDILISASGTIGRAIEFDGQDAYFQDSNIVWLEHDDSKVLNRFLYYCYQIADWKVSKGGTISRLYNDNIKKTLIPLPPLSEQRRIVEILDRFDTLTNSISEGLPREIALRRKQYEYYRDALLRFPPPVPMA